MPQRLLLNRWVGAPIVALAGVGAFYLGGTLVDSVPPVEYEHAEALAPEVAQGGTISVGFTVNRTRLCETLPVRRILTDADGIQHVVPTFTVGFPNTIGRDSYVRQITVPESAAVGHAEYQVRLRYACNWWQRVSGFVIEVNSPPIGFRILPRSP